ITVRLKQDFEWTPNGRTQLTFDSASGQLLSVQDPATAGTGDAIREAFYPVHSAKVGGVAMKLLMTFSGLSLAALGGLGMYAFWVRRASRRRKQQAARRLPGRRAAAASAS